MVRTCGIMSIMTNTYLFFNSKLSNKRKIRGFVCDRIELNYNQVTADALFVFQSTLTASMEITVSYI